MKRERVLVLVVAATFFFVATANLQGQPVDPEAVELSPAVTATEKEENPLSAWICLRAEVNKDWKAVGRYTEVFLTKGRLVPADIYYYDVGNTSYQELGFCVGYKAFSALGLNFWALPYYVIAEDSQYFGPCFWIEGGWGRWRFNSLPMYYLPLESEGTEQFSTCTTFLNYKVNDWLQVGVGGNVSWANIGDDEWKWRVGPNIVIKDPIGILPGGVGDLNLRFTWDQDEEVMLRIQKTFTF